MVSTIPFASSINFFSDDISLSIDGLNTWLHLGHVILPLTFISAVLISDNRLLRLSLVSFNSSLFKLVFKSIVEHLLSISDINELKSGISILLNSSVSVMILDFSFSIPATLFDITSLLISIFDS